MIFLVPHNLTQNASSDPFGKEYAARLGADGILVAQSRRIKFGVHTIGADR
jgi:hypothetical protein